MMWFARVTSQASVANGLVLALAFYWPTLADGASRAAVLVLLTLALTWINIVGVKQSSWVVNALTIGKLAPLLIFIAVGIWYIEPAHFAVMPPVTREQGAAAAILLIFAFGGYEVTGVLAGEAANPRRDVPFAFVATLIIVAVVMSLASVVATGVLPVAEWWMRGPRAVVMGATAVAVMILFRHRGNVQRLWRGTERALGT